MEHKNKYYYHIILSLLLINPIITIYPEMILDKRILDLGNDTINNSNITNPLNGINEGLYEDKPYIYFRRLYTISFLGIYFILLLKKTNNFQLLKK